MSERERHPGYRSPYRPGYRLPDSWPVWVLPAVESGETQSSDSGGLYRTRTGAGVLESMGYVERIYRAAVTGISCFAGSFTMTALVIEAFHR